MHIPEIWCLTSEFSCLLQRIMNCYILPEKFECDYYDFIKQKNRIPPEEYMFQYPWAEETLASLCF